MEFGIKALLLLMLMMYNRYSMVQYKVKPVQTENMFDKNIWPLVKHSFWTNMFLYCICRRIRVVALEGKAFLIPYHHGFGLLFYVILQEFVAESFIFLFNRIFCLFLCMISPMCFLLAVLLVVFQWSECFSNSVEWCNFISVSLNWVSLLPM